MNERQQKKNQKKQEMFTASWVNSYKELKKLDRKYHEYVVEMKRKRPYDHIWDMYYDEFEDWNEQEEE